MHLTAAACFDDGLRQLIVRRIDNHAHGNKRQPLTGGNLCNRETFHIDGQGAGRPVKRILVSNSRYGLRPAEKLAALEWLLPGKRGGEPLAPVAGSRQDRTVH